MVSDVLSSEKDEAALILTFQRRHVRNALNGQVIEALISSVEAARADASVSGIIITGGQEFFSAGADLNEALAAKSSQEILDFLDRFHRLGDALEQSPKPVIAAIEGFCLTGGFELALACDLRVAGAGSSFAITSSKIGTVAGFGGTQRLPRIVGRANALEILLGAEPIDAQAAFRIGLINRLTPKSGSLREAKAIVRIWHERAPLSLALAKQAVLRGSEMDLSSAMQLEKYLVSTIYTTRDKAEGISAFLEKRKPSFNGT